MIRYLLCKIKDNFNDMYPFIIAGCVLMVLIFAFGGAMHSCQQDTKRMRPVWEKRREDAAIHKRMKEEHLHIGHGCSLDPEREKK